MGEFSYLVIQGGYWRGGKFLLVATLDPEGLEILENFKNLSLNFVCFSVLFEKQLDFQLIYTP